MAISHGMAVRLTLEMLAEQAGAEGRPPPVIRTDIDSANTMARLIADSLGELAPGRAGERRGGCVVVYAGVEIRGCPECAAGDNVPVTRLQARKMTSLGRAAMASTDGYMDMLKKQMATELAMFMLRHDLIEFRRGPDDLVHFEFPLTAMVAVAAKKDVATLEQRINERQLEVAKMLVDETCEQIANWGSYYSGREGGRVEKGQALLWLREAFNKVKERCGK